MSDQLVSLFDAMRDPARLEIVSLLGRGGSMNVGDITAHLPLSRPAVSHHLKVLKTAGILTSEKRGQEVYYGLDRQRLVSTLRAMADFLENCCLPPIG